MAKYNPNEALLSLAYLGNLETIKYLVEVKGADKFDEAACRCNSLEKIAYLCDRGATDYTKIFYGIEDPHLSTLLYILNRGYVKDLDKCPDEISIFLKAGAGRILEYYPKLLKHPDAEPYLHRRLNIMYLLQKNLITNISRIVIEYLSYDIYISRDELIQLQLDFIALRDW